MLQATEDEDEAIELWALDTELPKRKSAKQKRLRLMGPTRGCRAIVPSQGSNLYGNDDDETCSCTDDNEDDD